MAVGWNFRKTILKAYIWLCEQYQPGDKIFLFGFSRGAYQARTLAALIDTVGLVNPGNKELIPLAYKVFLENQRHECPETVQHFKKTFSRAVKVHFLGAWDTVSPTGLVRGKPEFLPSCAEHVCVVRHGLAFDESDVDFIPVSVADTVSDPPPTYTPQDTQHEDDASSIETKISIETKLIAGAAKVASRWLHKRVKTEAIRRTETKSNLRNLKEVWFGGTHAEIGRSSATSLISSVPLLWMKAQAINAGLHISSSVISGPVQQDSPRKSSTIRTPVGKGRLISRDQLVHASVFFAERTLDDAWQSFIGQIEHMDFHWVECVDRDRLEMDLFDSTSIMKAIRALNDLWSKNSGGQHKDSDLESYWFQCLSFMALAGNVAETYLCHRPVWDDNPEVELRCAVKFFRALADRRPRIFNEDLAEVLNAHGRMLHLHGRLDSVEKMFEEALCIRRVGFEESPSTVSRRYKLAESLYWGASCGVALRQPERALAFFEEALDLIQPILSEEYRPAFSLFAALRRSFGFCLQNLCTEDVSQALKVAQTTVTLSEMLAQAFPQYTPLLAAALHDLAFGFPHRDFQVAEQSIALYRQLASETPETYNDVLADALYNYSCRLFSAGQHQEALRVSREEVQLRRESQTDKNALAACLDHLCRCLRAAGKTEEALNSAEQAVRLYRNLIEAHKTWQLESRLADSLANLSCCLFLVTGRAQHALHAAQEATSIQRGLARHTPAASFNLRLAFFLYNLSVCLSIVGRHGEALRAADEVVHIHTTWGTESDSALSLSRLALCFRAVARHEEALRIAAKSLDLTWGLRAREGCESQGVRVQLAETLLALSLSLQTDYPSQAIRAAVDSVDIFRGLAKSSPLVYDLPLAGALHQLSALLSASGESEAALLAAVEALHLGGHGLARDRFADFLYHLSTCFYAVGKQDQGLSPAHRSVSVCRELVREHGTWQFKEKLADALFNLSSFYAMADVSKALQALKEAVKIQREIAEHIPTDTLNQRLADGLQNLAARSLLAGNHKDALGFVEEAVGLTRSLVESDPVLHTPSLINTLYTYASVLCEEGRFEDGYRAICETDGLRKALCVDSIFTSVEASAAYMSTRARCVIGLGRHTDGLFCLIESIKLYKAAFAANTDSQSTFESFPWFFKNILASICALGKKDKDVLDAQVEVVELSRLLSGHSKNSKFEHSLEEFEVLEVP
ncbi:hypothetical protein FB45DRAFT_1025569 [Roridomyces roridus]|uniref:T6SS Phospholipase effector Tle1-like catalytic domain-containing protein n=1 Tax=Roridomyces roridus TaxID=1738132 RepID=A0AAD7BZ05_9AGAR|nr:hypothetical protein FB45DRAFT_1025569 [Roridomyces roridus]